MAFGRGSTERAVMQRHLMTAVVIAAITIVVIVAAGIAFDWTLAGAPDFNLTVDPAGDLPF